MSDPHLALREDVKLLGELLGETLKTQVDEKFFQAVENVRVLSKTAREGDPDSFNKLTEILTKLPTEQALLMARAFSHFLNLATLLNSITELGDAISIYLILTAKLNERLTQRFFKLC